MTGSLSIRGLRIARRGQEVLKGLDLDVQPGEICALMGESGAGKSTTLRAIAALEPFSGGEISVAGFTLLPGPLPPESHLGALRRSVGMVFQGHALFDHLTALDNVTLALRHVYRWDSARATDVARTLLTSLGVAACETSYPREVSGGEAQRIAIARALAPDPALLLMDEPTSALDPGRRGTLGATLRQLAASGRGLLLATHDAEFAREFAHRVVVLENGAIRST